VYVKLKDDRIQDLSFEGSGCAISVASASLMSEALKDKSVEEALMLFSRVHALLTRNDDSTDVASLGKLAALSGVHEYPSRVKCATLCWHTLKTPWTNSGSRPVSTE